MELAGHQCVGSCEIDKYAVRSYRAMHMVKEDEWHADDIRKVQPEELPEAECWTGGFPCQSFSIAGKRGGFEDTRGTLLFEILRLARVRKPKYLFLENVKGLLSHGRGETFLTIMQALGELGYDVEYQVLNSKNFGVPQNRERVYIIGYSGGFGGRKIFPIEGNDGETLKQIIGGSQGDRVYNPEGVSCTIAGEAGGLGGKTGLYLIGRDGKRKDKDYASCLTGGAHSGGNHSDMDLLIQPVLYNRNEGVTKETDCAVALASSDWRGLNRNQDQNAVMEVRAILTPDREEKRQNGRRMKEPGEPMFTLTSQDKHGIMIVDDQRRKDKLLKPMDSCPALRAEGHGNEPKVIDIRHPSDDKRVYSDGICPALVASDHKQMKAVFKNTRIRRLTPREC